MRRSFVPISCRPPHRTFLSQMKSGIVAESCLTMRRITTTGPIKRTLRCNVRPGRLTRLWRIVFWPASRPLLRLALASVWVPPGRLDTRLARGPLPSRAAAVFLAKTWSRKTKNKSYSASVVISTNLVPNLLLGTARLHPMPLVMVKSEQQRAIALAFLPPLEDRPSSYPPFLLPLSSQLLTPLNAQLQRRGGDPLLLTFYRPCLTLLSMLLQHRPPQQL